MATQIYETKTPISGNKYVHLNIQNILINGAGTKRLL